jgi:Lysine methyltransferase
MLRSIHTMKQSCSRRASARPRSLLSFAWRILCFLVVAIATLRNSNNRAYSLLMVVFKAKSSAARRVSSRRSTPIIMTMKKNAMAAAAAAQEERGETVGRVGRQPAAAARAVAAQVVEPNFHKVLERAGKTRFRPGGAAATGQLLDWCAASLTTAAATARDNDNNGCGCSVLELSGGMGHTGIEIAKKCGCHVLVTDIDEGRLELARALVLAAAKQQPAIADLVQTKKMDMFDIRHSLMDETADHASSSTSVFDCAITEASLTHFPLERKREFFHGLAPHANQYLLHEICFTTNDANIQKQVRLDMQHVLKLGAEGLGFFPETQETWTRLLIDAGFGNIAPDQVQVGPIAMLQNPMHLIRDEGIRGAAKVVRTMILDPYVRNRILATRAMLAKHSPEHLGYIIIRATKKPEEDDNKQPR